MKPRATVGRSVVGGCLLLLSVLVVVGVALPAHSSGPPLTAPAIGVSPGTIDSGQSETLSTVTLFGGGTAPYTCQWLQKAPHASGYTSLGGPVTCDPTSLISTSTGPLAIQGTWHFRLKVTDSSAHPAVAQSSPVSATVNALPVIPTPTPSSNPLDADQPLSIKVSWSGGTFPFMVSLYGSPTSFCGPSSPLIDTVGPLLSSPYTFPVPSPPLGSTWYCASVTDSAGQSVGGEVTVYSIATMVMVNPALIPPEIDSTAPVIDSGQSTTLAMVLPFGGGTPPYSCGWFKEAPHKTTFSALGGFITCSAGSTPPVSTGKMKVTGIYLYELVIRDSAGRPDTIPSGLVGIQVNDVVQPLKINATPRATTVGQTVKLSATEAIKGGSTTHWNGTDWYTCQWLERVPGSKVFVFMGQAWRCAASPPPTKSTGPLMATGAWDFMLQVADNVGWTRTTPHVSVQVGPGLGVPTLKPSRGAINAGESLSMKVTWKDGTPSFKLKLYSSLTKACSSASTLVASATLNTTAHTFSGLTPTADTWYCAYVTDSSASPITKNSATVDIVVHKALTAPGISLDAQAVDLGQHGMLSITIPPSGGTPGYECQWLQESPGSSSFSLLGSSFSCDTSTLPISTGQLLILGIWQFELNVSDAAHAEVTSLPVALTVNPVLTSPSVSASPPEIPLGQSAMLSQTTLFSGGTLGYSCQWMQTDPEGSNSSLGPSFSCDTSTLAVPFPTGPLLITGTWTFWLQVTDSSGTPETVQSPSVTVTVS